MDWKARISRISMGEVLHTPPTSLGEGTSMAHSVLIQTHALTFFVNFAPFRMNSSSVYHVYEYSGRKADTPESWYLRVMVQKMSSYERKQSNGRTYIVRWQFPFLHISYMRTSGCKIKGFLCKPLITTTIFAHLPYFFQRILIFQCVTPSFTWQLCDRWLRDTVLVIKAKQSAEITPFGSVDRKLSPALNGKRRKVNKKKFHKFLTVRFWDSRDKWNIG